ncbi:CDP-diacylglycerol--glycerol-3-phosphate 3-phosphatidyltransferase [Orientia tsutsugamushi]|uniref:CDP-diacylglycerol--glycerol-3-phosphate 3-phosphatidyltransferase n=1 Tax=Orientia tsutsugamushi (strain Boryong) TaxID=357244 RepID=A5CFA1_ORITB|nr:CDP-diacylglycerol--glycerol-3-phosphate 3-phosphatidyltransferase [Orientia tsutsugamushi]CAM81024.1 CDP-diacylglycerol--glycerol-3-phosphate 3-phosphatidyltransferase [Orientia tsutsugamushi str. Boryong]
MQLTRKIPNILTATRISIIPIILITFYFDDVIFSHQLAATLFVIAGITDFFDGYIARKLNLHSSFGRMLDHIADKLLVGSILIMIVKFRRAQELPCLLILCREFLVAGMREFLSQIKVSVPVSRLAKIKTTCQFSALAILLLGSKGSGIHMLDIVGQITLWIAAILTIITGYSYLKACIKYF